MWRIVIVAVVLTFTRQCVEGQECPCELRQADPVFPGSDGTRWDCEYVSHGLSEIPTSCWALNPDVTQIFLDYNSISQVTGDSFSGLTNLRTLSLKENNIATIDNGALAGLSQLEFLDVSGNSLTEPPPEIWSLTTLTQLYLGDNQLTDANNYGISNLVNLEVLDLHLNHLPHIPDHILEPLTKLRSLHLYWNMITELPILTENLQLEEVLVNGNAIDVFPKYVFGDLTKPLTYHFQDNPAYDIWATMLLPLPVHSHIMMGYDVFVWAEDEQQAKLVLQGAEGWLVVDGLQEPIDLSTLLRICANTTTPNVQGRIPPC
ncbi:leucine-rich repeat-containing G-protein coupled receptor 4-like [Homarus americanus]|uniref:leucine-rich repeat-containing G-protein coupled receptor 4-like n=1 Tax=Homarus americanus TaxID=6706 RepID=UPI001C4705E2|nr:leucine-rich repeat-containing G-protein coupled receptor 4-like [Homarus americanus]